MKRWLKKHGKWIVVGLGVFFIANSGYGIFTTTEEWKIIVHVVAIMLWVVILLLASGILEKLYRWWDKD